MASEDDMDVEEILGDLDDEERAEQEMEQDEKRKQTEQGKIFKATGSTVSPTSVEQTVQPVAKVRRNQRKGGYQSVPTSEQVSKDSKETLSTNTTSATFGTSGIATRNAKNIIPGGAGGSISNSNSGSNTSTKIDTKAATTRQQFASQKTRLDKSIQRINDAGTNKTTTITNTKAMANSTSSTTTITSQDTSNALDMLNPKKSGSIGVLFDFEMLKTLYAMAIFVAGAVELFTATFSTKADDVLVWACLWLVLLAGHVLFLFILVIIIGIHGSGPHRAAVIMYAINLSMQIVIMTLVVAVAFDMYYHTNSAQTDNRLVNLGLAPVAANNFNLIKWYAILVLFLLITVIDFGATAFIVLHDRMCCQWRGRDGGVAAPVTPAYYICIIKFIHLYSIYPFTHVENNLID